MALQATITDPNTGLDIPNAYVRLNGLSIDGVGQAITLNLGIYVSAAQRQDNPNGLVLAWTVALPTAEYAALLGQPIDVRAVAYGWLKANDARLAGATDV